MIDIPNGLDSNLSKFLSSVKEKLEILTGERGDSSKQAVTWDEFVRAGFDPTAIRKSQVPVYDQTSNKADKQAPAAPRDLQVQNQYVQNVLTWNNPSDSDLYYIEVWRSLTISRDDAGSHPLAALTVTDSQRGKSMTYTDTPIDPTKTYYYWVRAVDYAGNRSPWSPPDAQGGYVVPPFPGTDFNAVLDQLFGTGNRYQTVVKFLCDAFYVCTTPQAGFPDGKQVFGIGNVDGTPTLGFLGNAFFDNFLEARMIKAAAVNADAVAAGSIGTEKLAAQAVTAEKIAVGTIIASLIAAGAITAEKIAAGAITAEKIAAGTITGDKMQAGTITADLIQGVSWMDGMGYDADGSNPNAFSLMSQYASSHDSKYIIIACGIAQSSNAPLQIVVDGQVVRNFLLNKSSSSLPIPVATLVATGTLAANTQHSFGAKIDVAFFTGHLEYAAYVINV